MNTLYIMCGLPGSGKTTLSEQLSKTYNLKLYCFDKLKLIFDRDAILKNIEKDIIKSDVIFDNLFLTKKSRQSLLENINTPCSKILIVLETPLDECINRNRQREFREQLSDDFIYHLQKRYQPPSLDEGWDDIIFLK